MKITLCCIKFHKVCSHIPKCKKSALIQVMICHGTFVLVAIDSGLKVWIIVPRLFDRVIETTWFVTWLLLLCLYKSLCIVSIMCESETLTNWSTVTDTCILNVMKCNVYNVYNVSFHLILNGQTITANDDENYIFTKCFFNWQEYLIGTNIFQMDFKICCPEHNQEVSFCATNNCNISSFMCIILLIVVVILLSPKDKFTCPRQWGK